MAQKKTYENPERRSKNKEINKIRCADPLVRKQMSESHLGYIMPEEQKIARSNGMKKFYSEHPEVKEHTSMVQRKRFEDPNERKKVSDRMSGEKNPNFGKTFSEEYVKKLSDSHKGKTGSMASNWQGGITPLNAAIRECPKYKEWVEAVFKRDNYTCQISGAKGGHLEAHHIIRFAVLIKRHKIKTLEQSLLCDALWDVSNGITVEREIHKSLHRGKGTRGSSEE